MAARRKTNNKQQVYYYRRQRRFRYITGLNNYYRCRIDIPLQIGFSAGQQPADVKMFIAGQYFTDVSISNLVNNNIQYTSLKNIFDQVRLNGIRYKINIANIISFANPIQFCIGYANNDQDSFNTLVNDNRSLTLNLNGPSSKYVPIDHLDYIGSNSLANYGYVSIRASTALSLEQVPILFAGTISLYFLFRYNTS